MSGVPAFFSGPGEVWVSENFQSVLLGTYAKSNQGDDSSVSYVDLKDMRSDTDARGFLFQNPDFFLEQLMVLLQNQTGGKEGALLNDSSANYFFLKAKDGNVYSVLVRWEPAQKLWRCGAYLQTEIKMPSVRVFRPL